MSTECRHIMRSSGNPTDNPNIGTFELEIGTPVTPALGNVYTEFGFSTPFCCVLATRSRQTDRRTDGRTGKPITRSLKTTA